MLWNHYYYFFFGNLQAKNVTDYWSKIKEILILLLLLDIIFLKIHFTYNYANGNLEKNYTEKNYIVTKIIRKEAAEFYITEKL